MKALNRLALDLLATILILTTSGCAAFMSHYQEPDKCWFFYRATRIEAHDIAHPQQVGGGTTWEYFDLPFGFAFETVLVPLDAIYLLCHTLAEERSSPAEPASSPNPDPSQSIPTMPRTSEHN